MRPASWRITWSRNWARPCFTSTARRGISRRSTRSTGLPERALEPVQGPGGRKIIAGNALIAHTTPEVRLALGEQIVETPRKPNLGWAPDLEKYLRTTSAGETVVRLPLRFLHINDDMAIWSAPLEMFCEVAIKCETCPRSPTLSILVIATAGWDTCPPARSFHTGAMSPAFHPTRRAPKTMCCGRWWVISKAAQGREAVGRWHGQWAVGRRQWAEGSGQMGVGCRQKAVGRR